MINKFADKSSASELINNLLQTKRHKILAVILLVLLVAMICLGVMMIFSNSNSNKNSYDEYTLSSNISLPNLESVQKVEELILGKSSRYMYGLPIDEYNVIQNEIERGETFSKLLNNRFNVNIADINTLISRSKGKLDMRDIRAGNSYTAFMSADSSDSKLEYLVYEKNQTDYVIFALKDSLYVEAQHKDVKTRECFAEGVIKSSLYATIYENNLNPMIAGRLSEIFKWTIDFFALQKGDKFRVLYQEHFIDTTSIGMGKIYGAEFIHNGKSYWAIRFKQGDEQGYWDIDGKNLRKNFLRAPLSFSARISSKFGMRVHPITRIRRPHNGVDYACPVGTPVMAVADGVVTRRYYDRGGGNTVRIKHAQGLESGYLHLSRFGKGVAIGSRVKQGQIIGYVGSTGMSTGPHLDFRIWQNGKPIDPLKMPSMPTNPISKKNMAEFEQMKKDVMNVINEYDPAK